MLVELQLLKNEWIPLVHMGSLINCRQNETSKGFLTLCVSLFQGNPDAAKNSSPERVDRSGRGANVLDGLIVALCP